MNKKSCHHSLSQFNPHLIQISLVPTHVPGERNSLFDRTSSSFKPKELLSIAGWLQNAFPFIRAAFAYSFPLLGSQLVLASDKMNVWWINNSNAPWEVAWRSCWQCVQVGSTIYNSTKREDCLTNNNNVHRQQLKTAASQLWSTSYFKTPLSLRQLQPFGKADKLENTNAAAIDFKRLREQFT